MASVCWFKGAWPCTATTANSENCSLSPPLARQYTAALANDMYCKQEVACVFEDHTSRFGDAVHVLVLAAGEAKKAASVHECLM